MISKVLSSILFLSLPGIILAACKAPMTTPTTIFPTSWVEITEGTPTTTQVIEVTPTNGSGIIDPALNYSEPVVPVQVNGIYRFTEGPATASDGSVFFSDIDAGKIFQWSPDGNVSLFVQDLDLPNGSQFDSQGNLIVCEGGKGRLISIDPQGRISILVDQYDGIPFNEPNDLWITPQDGIYFTDPAFRSPVILEGQNVYYLSPDHHILIRVISDMEKPNGIVGTEDGKTLYVSDYSADQTFAYTINSDGRLSDKRLFVATGSDGMTLDAMGNIYQTLQNRIQIYSPGGSLLNEIQIPESPTNLTFAGSDGQTLFITARSAVYTVQMAEEGSNTQELPMISSSGFTLTSPDLPADGRLPVEYTCDGKASTLALTWNGAPEGTKSFAVIMHHVASPSDIHWYLVLYNIPANVTNLPKNFTGIGTLGTNSVNDRPEYAPPCSKGPGDKTYIYTVYALSTEPQLVVPASQVTRTVLLAAIKDITLASAELRVVYARP